MKPVGQTLTDKILKNGQCSGVVKTPKGNISIFSLIERRGNLIPQEFRYVELPNMHGQFFTLAKTMRKYWETCDFVVKEWNM